MSEPSTASTLISTTISSTSTSATLAATSTSTAVPSTDGGHHLSSVVAFIIGFAIIMGSSLLNAAGLNLTKLDHVRCGALPKASRQKDWKRPLWLLGMFLYIISQLIGSTLALEYMRAEYVAPLGSSSLIFNFLFASFLLGTPVTRNDVYGTLIIVIGVIGIVAFGSINSGLVTAVSLERLQTLWSRGGWLFFFITSFISITLLYLVVTQLDAVLISRSDIGEEPVTLSGYPPNASKFQRAKYNWLRWNYWLRDTLNDKMANKSDKQVAWFLGVGWSLVGGLMAGGCLVFAKACVKLFSNSLSGSKDANEGNAFLHAASIVTLILLVLTAVMQIVCLNRGLKAYDSTLVVPVFYGIYTATGFVNSLIFNDEVDAYANWTLFLIGVFMLILIGGVVLLTSKKPQAANTGSMRLGIGSGLPMHARERRMGGSMIRERGERQSGMKSVMASLAGSSKTTRKVSFRDDDESISLHHDPHPEREEQLFDVGAATDSDDDELAVVTPASSFKDSPLPRDGNVGGAIPGGRRDERRGLMDEFEEEEPGVGGDTRTLR